MCSELVSTRKREVSWKECWKYKLSVLQQLARHLGDAAAVLYFKLLLFLRWRRNVLFYPHFSYHWVNVSQTAVRGYSVFSLVSLTEKGFSEIKSFWKRDLNYREPTGISSQPELIPDKRRKLFCVMASASCFMVLCVCVTSLAWVKLWCKKRVVSVGVLAGKLLPAHAVEQFPLLISSWVWRKDQLNACRRILHPFSCHSRLICQEGNTNKFHYSKREQTSLLRFQSVS